MFHLGSVTSIALKIPQNIVKPNEDAIRKTRKLGFTFSILEGGIVNSGRNILESRFPRVGKMCFCGHCN